MGMHPNTWGSVWHCVEHPALWVSCCHVTHVFLWPFWAILGGCALDAACLKCVILFANVMSLNDTVMSHVMSQHSMCIGHVTIYYKRATNTLVGILACCSFIRQVRLYHQRPVCGWCLTRVGCHVTSVSPGGSLLPSIVIIVLALVNSAMSPAGTHKYLNKTQECHSTPC